MIIWKNNYILNNIARPTNLHIFFTFSILLICISSVIYCGIDQDHVQFLAKNKPKITCGQYKDPTSKGKMFSSRIINGKEGKWIYPWMIKIINYKKYYLPKGGPFDDPSLDPDKTHFNLEVHSAGSIITRAFILTCAHCICMHSDQPHQEWLKDLHSCSRKKDFNYLIQEKRNGIEKRNYFSIRTWDNSYPQIFDDPKHMQAIIQPFPTKEDNIALPEKGDIGYLKILDKTKILPSQLTPICLPTVGTFSEDLEATAAGWGRRFSKTKSTYKYTTTCLTNGIGPAVFQQCMPIPRPYDVKKNKKPEFCRKIPPKFVQSPNFDAPEIKTISTKGNKATALLMDVGEILMSHHDEKCFGYWRAAEKAAGEDWKTIMDTVDGIKIVRTKNNQQGMPQLEDEVCINVREAGKYGICKTRTNMWGLCSRSCIMSNKEYPNYPERYEETKIKLYANHPSNVLPKIIMELQ